MRGTHQTLTAACVLTLASCAGCAGYRAGVPTTWSDGMGYVSGGVVAHASFADSDAGPGAGYSITVPPLSGVCVAAIAIAAAGPALDIMNQALDPIITTTAISGVSDQDRELIAEASLDLTFTQTFHRQADGSDLTHSAVLLGARLTGPERYRPSYSLSAGVAWHRFDYESVSSAGTMGPYWSAALQYYLSEEEVRLFLEYRRLYFNDAAPNISNEGARHVVVGVSGHWYF